MAIACKATDEAPRNVKAGCRKRINFKGSGRRDAVVRHIGCGESRQGCRGPALRVSPCPLKLIRFREAAGHPASCAGLHRLPCTLLPSIRKFSGYWAVKFFNLSICKAPRGEAHKRRFETARAPFFEITALARDDPVIIGRRRWRWARVCGRCSGRSG